MDSGRPLKRNARHAKGAFIEQDAVCRKCRYSLRGLPNDGLCPECATPVSLSLEDAPPFVHKPAEATTVEDETYCVRCGALLQTLSTHDACPSCAAPVWFSIYGNWLRVSDPGWLRRIKLGVRLWLYATCGWVVLYVLIYLNSLLLYRLFTLQHHAYFYVARTIASYFFAVLLFVGFFCLTRHEPVAIARESKFSLRRIVRALMVASVIGSAYGFLLPLIEALRQPGLHAVISPLAAAIVAALSFGTLVYLRWLARRIPHSRLERHTTVILWLQCVWHVLNVVAIVITSGTGLYEQSRFMPVSNPFSIVLAVAMLLNGLIYLIASVWAIPVLIGYRRALHRAIETVEADTAGAVPSGNP